MTLEGIVAGLLVWALGSCVFVIGLGLIAAGAKERNVHMFVAGWFLVAVMGIASVVLIWG